MEKTSEFWTKASGSLQQIMMTVKGGESYIRLVIKYLDGFVSVPVDKEKSVPSFLEEHDIAIADALVDFVVDNQDVPYRFRLCLFEDDVNNGGLIGQLFPELRYLQEMKPNAKITNCGMTFHAETTYQLFVTANIPQEFVKYKLADAKDEDWLEKPFTGSFTTLPVVKEKHIQHLSIDCANEGWNGPQNYGGINWIEDHQEKEIVEHDFDLSYIPKDVVFDPNTFIGLYGNGSNRLIVQCYKKDLELFCPLMQLRDTELSTDIQNLLER